MVYVGSNDNGVYALNASTGARFWSYTTGGSVYSSPAVGNGVVYVGSFDDKVYALNANTGDKLWSYATGGEVTSSPAVVHGTVYIGCGSDVCAFGLPVGANPYGVAFDGANVWVVGGNLTKLRASDGQVLGTFATGGLGVTFDGANVWITNGSNTSPAVTKVRASDGKVLGTFSLPGVVPFWMAFDGANIWVPTSNANGNGWVTKLRASDGKNLGNFTVGIPREPWLSMARTSGSRMAAATVLGRSPS